MLRIGLPPTPPEDQPDLPPQIQGKPDADPDEDADSGKGPGKYSADKASQQIAGYMGPENGPFACGNCEYFDGQGSCMLVAGKIDPQGCCNLFTPNDHDGDEADQSEGAPPPADNGPVVKDDQEVT